MKFKPMGKKIEQNESRESLFAQLKERFGVINDPFGATLDFFYHGGGREDLVAKAVHTLRFGDLIPLVTGEKGLGKTTLLAEVIKAVKDEFKVVILKAPMLMGEIRFLEMLFSKDNYVCPVPLDEGNPAGLLNALTGYLEHKKTLTNPRPNTLIVIDDSDDLSEEVLRLLLMAQQKVPTKESGVRWLMAAQSEWVGGLAVKYPELGLDALVYQLPVHPLSSDDTERYVKLRLYKAGARSEILLSEQHLNGLANLGKGNPGRINRVAAGVLLGVMAEEERPSSSASWHFPWTLSDKNRSLLIIGGVCLISLGVMWGAFSEDEGEQNRGASELVKSEPVSRPLPGRLPSVDPQANTLPDKVTGEEVVEPMDSSELDRSVADELPAAEEGGQEAEVVVAQQQEVTAESKVEEIGVSGADVDAEAESMTAEEVSATMLPAKKPTVVPQKTVSSAIPVVQKVTQKSEKVRVGDEVLVAAEKVEIAKQPENSSPTSPTHPAFRDSAWVSQLNTSHYVVQLLGGYSEDTAKKFLRQYPDQNFVYILSTYKGKPWFVVLDGAFPSKDAAQKSIARYPEGLQKQKPWIRSVKGIQ